MAGSEVGKSSREDCLSRGIACDNNSHKTQLKLKKSVYVRAPYKCSSIQVD